MFYWFCYSIFVMLFAIWCILGTALLAGFLVCLVSLFIPNSRKVV